MGCASSKPQVNQPTTSVPSSVTPSVKQTGHEKSVRFADEHTEISDKRHFEENSNPVSPGHSLGVLQDVVDDGAPKSSPAVNHVVETPKVEEVKVHSQVAPPVVENHHPVHVPEPAAVVHHPEPVAVQHSHEVEKHVESHAVKHEEAPAVAAVKEEAVSHSHTETHAVASPPTPASVETTHSEPAVETPASAPTPAPAAPVFTPAVAAAPVENKVPDKKKGYMLKQGHVVKNWKNRFFILEEGLLTYYESSTANAPYGVNKKGEFSMKDVTVTDAKNLVTLSSRGKNGADLVLEIKYPNEREEWMAAFKQHAAWLKTSGR